MMRLHFYTAICLLLVPSAFCSLEEELSNVWKNLQSSICYQLIRPEYLDNYVKNFDTYWDFDYTTRAMNDIYEKYYMYDSYEQRDCPEKSYIDYHYK